MIPSIAKKYSVKHFSIHFLLFWLIPLKARSFIVLDHEVSKKIVSLCALRHFIPFKFSFQIIASPSLRGWYDASSESSNWMKSIRSSDDKSSVNIQHIFINGQVSSDEDTKLFEIKMKNSQFLHFFR